MYFRYNAKIGLIVYNGLPISSLCYSYGESHVGTLPGVYPCFATRVTSLFLFF